MTENQLKIEIEQYIDKYGLPALLRVIEMIAFEKAEHVLTEWQDESLSLDWTISAEIIEGAADQINDIL